MNIFLNKSKEEKEEIVPCTITIMQNSVHRMRGIQENSSTGYCWKRTMDNKWHVVQTFLYSGFSQCTPITIKLRVPG